MAKNVYLKKIILIGMLLIILILVLYLYIGSNNKTSVDSRAASASSNLAKANAALAKCKSDSSKALAKCKSDSSKALAKSKSDSSNALSKCNKELINIKNDLSSKLVDLEQQLIDTNQELNNLGQQLSDCYSNQSPIQPPTEPPPTEPPPTQPPITQPPIQRSGLQLDIKTSRDLYSGTDSMVILYFYDDTYTSKTQDKPIIINEINFPFNNFKYNPPYRPIIIKGSADRFEAGKTDKFFFVGNYSIDFSKPIWLGLESSHDPSYTISDSWKVESVTINILSSDGSQSGREIIINQWLAYGQYIDISKY